MHCLLGDLASARGMGFFPQGNGFFSESEDFAFSPKGKASTCPDGRGDASQDAGWFIAAPSRRDDSRPLPGPPIVPHPRKRLAASATGGAAPLSPHFLFLDAPKSNRGPHKIRRFCGERRGKGTERSPRRRRGRSGVDFAPTTGRARSKREKALRLNIRGIPNGGAPGVTERSCLYICPRRMDLYCFAAGDGGVVLRSHAFLGHLWKTRLLLFPRLSSFVSRRISLVPRPSSPVSRGNAQGGTAVPS